MEKIIMKSFLYTIAVLFGIMTVAQAAPEAKGDEVAIEEVNAEASPETKADNNQEETK